MPLPLSVVAQLEAASTTCGEHDFLDSGLHLADGWAGLCWSDAQRVQFSSLCWDSGSLRGQASKRATDPPAMGSSICTGGAGQSHHTGTSVTMATLPSISLLQGVKAHQQTKDCDGYEGPSEDGSP